MNINKEGRKKRVTEPWEDRLKRKITIPYPIGISDCWIWKDKKDKLGYGHFWRNGEMINAHRASYELFVGKIPKDLHIDHLCRNPLG